MTILKKLAAAVISAAAALSVMNITAFAADNSAKNNTLVVYFSMPDNVDDSTVEIDGQTLGNTQYMAQVIAEETGADIFRIEPETAYPTNHSTLVDIALEEQNDNARPAIKDEISDFSSYDTVFVGYPIWWSDMPMIMYTFFDSYDFSGKTLVPFSTHGGSSFSGTPQTIARLEPDAIILDGMTVSRDDIHDARDDIERWVKGLDIKSNAANNPSDKKPAITSARAGDTRASIEWNDVEGAVKYRVYYLTSSGKLKRINDYTKTSCSLKGMKNGRTYQFAVRAYFADGSYTTVTKSDLVSVTPREN